jgi:hypothetical protein
MPAGAAPGERRGGRQKGTTNKLTKARDESEKAARAVAFGSLTEDQIQALTPKDIFRLVAHHAVRTMDIPLMLKAASELAPYVHPRLTATTLEANVRSSPSDYTDAELLALASAGMGEEGDGEAISGPH